MSLASAVPGTGDIADLERIGPRKRGLPCLADCVGTPLRGGMRTLAALAAVLNGGGLK